MAAIIVTHKAMKKANEPRRVATPMFIPPIWRTASTQQAAASPTVTVRAVAVAALLSRVVAAARPTGMAAAARAAGAASDGRRV
jgi:hypothetical protein